MPDKIAAQIEKFHTAARQLWIGDLDTWAKPAFHMIEIPKIAAYTLFDYNVLLFNPDYYYPNQPDYLFETVGHEMGHLIAARLYGEKAIVRPHGKEWRHVMIVLGIPPKIYHSYPDPKRADTVALTMLTTGAACKKKPNNSCIV